MDYTTYILYDRGKDRCYVGQTQNIEDRLKRHLGKREKYTKRGNWELVYKEVYSTRSEAVCREREIKGWKSKVMIRKLVAAS